MKYDDASWHYGGDFPEDLADEAGGTHIGMFMVWCLLNGMVGEIHGEELPEGLDELKNRKVNPGAWFLIHCDEKFTDEDLSDYGNKFAAYYYAADSTQYLDDYEEMVGGKYSSLYYVPDTWETFDCLSPKIRNRFEKWEKNNN